jgi:hypothetical protein
MPRWSLSSTTVCWFRFFLTHAHTHAHTHTHTHTHVCLPLPPLPFARAHAVQARPACLASLSHRSSQKLVGWSVSSVFVCSVSVSLLVCLCVGLCLHLHLCVREFAPVRVSVPEFCACPCVGARVAEARACLGPHSRRRRSGQSGGHQRSHGQSSQAVTPSVKPELRVLVSRLFRPVLLCGSHRFITNQPSAGE